MRRHIHPLVRALETRISPAVFTVTNTNDSGSGSLRQAIVAANASTGADTIVFESTYFNIPRTITLTSGNMLITETLTIQGPGAGLLTVSANNNGSVFHVDPGSGNQAVSISGMTITQANEPCVYLVSYPPSHVTISGCKFTGNSDSAVLETVPGASLAIVNSTISGNSGTIDGMIHLYRPQAFSIQNSTISGNHDHNGGAISIYGTVPPNSATILNCTLCGNSASNDGGAVWLVNFGGNLAIQNSTIVNNTASGSFGGGGIARVSGSGSISLDSCIVANNKHTTGNYSDLFSGGIITANYCAVGSAKYVSGFTPDVTTSALLGMDFKLGPLANNGGPTQTVSLLTGSPCINSGSNIGMLTTDQRGRPRSVGVTDIGALEVQPPTKVSSVAVGDGTNQRSMVTQLVVTFNSPVVFTGSVAAAFALARQSDNMAVVLSETVDATNSSVTITFVGGAVDNKSLADGRYTLNIFASQFGAEGLDGNGDGSAGDDYQLVGSPGTAPNLFRFFGDINGDGTVSASDFILFRQYFGGSLSAFDFDGDGSVSANDFIQFRLRFGGSI
jgi:hypothetical protein